MKSFTNTWKKYLNEQSNKKMYVFDFDDTIIKSSAPV